MSNRFRFTEETRSNKQTEHVAFDVTDNRGRAMGANIYTWDATFAYKENEDERWGLEREPGEYFAFVPHTTRNGANYGPLQTVRYFLNRRDRQLAIDKYLADARKRAAKQSAVRCSDCGKAGERTGHMDCQYPQNH